MNKIILLDYKKKKVVHKNKIGLKISKKSQLMSTSNLNQIKNKPFKPK